MNVRTLDIELFVRHARRVLAMLNDSRQRTRLLRAACADTPIVREILAAGHHAADARSTPKVTDTLERMEQDLITFLALREIEACDVGNSWRAVQQVGPSSQN